MKARENVFAFRWIAPVSRSCKCWRSFLLPPGNPIRAPQLYHFVGNITEEPAYGGCHPACQFPQITALGDSCGIVATGILNKVENAPKEDGTAEMLVC